jgi:hypothetical protein
MLGGRDLKGGDGEGFCNYRRKEVISDRLIFRFSFYEKKLCIL